MVRAEEEAFSYERVRYAFRDSSLAHLDLADGSAVSTSKLAEADAVEATAAIEAFEGRGERRALWSELALLVLVPQQQLPAAAQTHHPTAATPILSHVPRSVRELCRSISFVPSSNGQASTEQALAFGTKQQNMAIRKDSKSARSLSMLIDMNRRELFSMIEQPTVPA